MLEYEPGVHLHHEDVLDGERVQNLWTAPRTWVTSEIVTSTIMNTHVRDNLLAIVAATGSSPPGSPALYDRWAYPQGNGVWEFVYRNDLDGSYPWHFIGGAPMVVTGSTSYSSNGEVCYVAVPRTGVYTAVWSGGASSSVGGALLYAYASGGQIHASGNNGMNNTELSWNDRVTCSAGAHLSVYGYCGAGGQQGAVSTLPVKVA